MNGVYQNFENMDFYKRVIYLGKDFFWRIVSYVIIFPAVKNYKANWIDWPIT